jgi:hypothetical protein
LTRPHHNVFHKEKLWVLIPDKAAVVADLCVHLGALFKVNGEIELLLEGFVLPQQENLQLLTATDILRLVFQSIVKLM